MPKPVQRIWKCQCGDVQLRLTGEPILNLRCHCHSCVACARYIDEKYNHNGTSMIHSCGGGVCASPYAAGQVKVLTPLSTSDPSSDGDTSSKLKFVRVGENGRIWRSYTTCCGTQLANMAKPGMIVLNRNAIYNQDGTKYEPREIPLNINKKHAFDPDSVPKPSHDVAPPSVAFKFVKNIANPFGARFKDVPELFPAVDAVEVMPVSW